MKLTIINQPLNNRGDEAAHRAFIHALLNDGHEVRVLFACNSQKDIDAFRVEGAEYERIEPKFFFYKFAVGVLKKGLDRGIIRAIWRIHPVVRKISAIYKDSDMVICAPGGTCLGHMMNWMHLFMILLAHENACKVGYFARSIGPFDGLPANFRSLAIEALDHCDKISLRDLRSCDEAEKLNLTYIKTIDSAFLEVPRAQIPQNLLPEGKYMVFVPNELCWHTAYRDKLTPEQVQTFFVKVLNYMLEKSSASIVMLPQLFHQKAFADEDFFKRLSSACICPERVVVCPDSLSSDIQQTIIAGSSAVVGSRYHSVIFAINNSRPFVAFSYEHKISGMLALLGLQNRMVNIEEIGLGDAAYEEFCLRFDELSTCSVTRDKAAELARNAYDAFMNNSYTKR